MEDANPDFWYAHQFANPANVNTHREIGNEIILQTNFRLDVFATVVGTGRTLSDVEILI